MFQKTEIVLTISVFFMPKGVQPQKPSLINSEAS